MTPCSPEEIAAIIYCGVFAIALAGAAVISLLWSALAVLAQSGRVRGEPVPDYDKLGEKALQYEQDYQNMTRWTKPNRTTHTTRSLK